MKIDFVDPSRTCSTITIKNIKCKPFEKIKKVMNNAGYEISRPLCTDSYNGHEIGFDFNPQKNADKLVKLIEKTVKSMGYKFALFHIWKNAGIIMFSVEK